MGKFTSFGVQRAADGRGGLRNPALLRVAKDVSELTKVLPALAVGRVVVKKGVGHMIRFLNAPGDDNRYTPCPGTCRT